MNSATKLIIRYFVMMFLILILGLRTNELVFSSDRGRGSLPKTKRSYVPQDYCLEYSKRIPARLLGAKWKLKQKEIYKNGTRYGRQPQLPQISALYEKVATQSNKNKSHVKSAPDKIGITIYFFSKPDEAVKFTIEELGGDIHNPAAQVLPIDNIDTVVLIDQYSPNPAAVPYASDIFNSFIVARKDNIVLRFYLVPGRKLDRINHGVPPGAASVAELMKKHPGKKLSDVLSKGSKEGIDVDFVKDFLKRLIRY